MYLVIEYDLQTIQTSDDVSYTVRCFKNMYLTEYSQYTLEHMKDCIDLKDVIDLSTTTKLEYLFVRFHTQCVDSKPSDYRFIGVFTDYKELPQTSGCITRSKCDGILMWHTDVVYGLNIDTGKIYKDIAFRRYLIQGFGLNCVAPVNVDPLEVSFPFKHESYDEHRYKLKRYDTIYKMTIEEDEAVDHKSINQQIKTLLARKRTCTERYKDEVYDIRHSIIYLRQKKHNISQHKNTRTQK